MHADHVAPYELVAPYLNVGWYGEESYMRDISEAEKESLNATWASLPDFGSDENALAAIDTSGSMFWDQKPIPAAVAPSQGLYLAVHNTCPLYTAPSPRS